MGIEKRYIIKEVLVRKLDSLNEFMEARWRALGSTNSLSFEDWSVDKET